MRYVAFTPELEPTDKIIVDTWDCGRGLHLSHFPGNQTPPELKADLGVEIALRLAVHPWRAEYLGELDVVTNDHFDCDGLLTTFAVLRPEEARRHRAALIDASEAGDFYEVSSPRAVEFHHLVDAFLEPDTSPLSRDLKGRSTSERNQLCTDALLAELPGLLYEPERHRRAWEESYRRHLGRLALVSSGRVRVQEYPGERLSVIHTPEPLDDYGRHYAARGHRLLEVIERAGDRCYVLNYRVAVWYELVSRSTSLMPRLHDLAARLDGLETDRAGRWAITEWNPALRRAHAEPDAAGCAPPLAPLCPSTIAVDRVVAMLRQELHAADETARSSARRQSGRSLERGS